MSDPRSSIGYQMRHRPARLSRFRYFRVAWTDDDGTPQQVVATGYLRACKEADDRARRAAGTITVDGKFGMGWCNLHTIEGKRRTKGPKA